MAKDGTNRGNRAGNYTGAGRKAAPLADKIAAGTAKTARVLEAPTFAPDTELEANVLAGADLTGSDMPPPNEYLRSKQRDGRPLGADLLYVETWTWLKARGCEKFVNPRLIEAYAQAFARYVQCEEAITASGLLGSTRRRAGPLPARSSR